MRGKREADKDEEDDGVQHYDMGFKIVVTFSSAETVMCIRWIQGQDTVLFESFCGMMKRRIEDSLKSD
jgi:23S rRNA (adenine1618-N6)-methyltransferase